MARWHQATSHYLSQCWPNTVSPHGVTRPQWVNSYLTHLYQLTRMMTASHRNDFCIAGLCEGNPPVTAGFPSQRASNVQLWCFLLSQHEWAVELQAIISAFYWIKNLVLKGLYGNVILTVRSCFWNVSRGFNNGLVPQSMKLINLTYQKDLQNIEIMVISVFDIFTICIQVYDSHELLLSVINVSCR